MYTLLCTCLVLCPQVDCVFYSLLWMEWKEWSVLRKEWSVFTHNGTYQNLKLSVVCNTSLNMKYEKSSLYFWKNPLLKLIIFINSFLREHSIFSKWQNRKTNINTRLPHITKFVLGKLCVITFLQFFMSLNLVIFEDAVFYFVSQHMVSHVPNITTISESTKKIFAT